MAKKSSSAPVVIDDQSNTIRVRIPSADGNAAPKIPATGNPSGTQTGPQVGDQVPYAPIPPITSNG
jgi:hypothetical protein